MYLILDRWEDHLEIHTTCKGETQLLDALFEMFSTAIRVGAEPKLVKIDELMKLPNDDTGWKFAIVDPTATETSTEQIMQYTKERLQNDQQQHTSDP